MINGTDAAFECAEITPRHGDRYTGFARGSKNGNGPPTGIAGHGDFIGIDLYIGQRPIDQTGHVPHPFPDGRSAGQQTMAELYLAGMDLIRFFVFLGSCFAESPCGRRDGDVALPSGLNGHIPFSFEHMLLFVFTMV